MAGGIAVTLRSSCSCMVTFYRHAIPTSLNILKNVTCIIYYLVSALHVHRPDVRELKV